jgi:hypothetical protein
MLKQNKTNSNKGMTIEEKDFKQTGNMELRKRLPRGAIQQIADEMGISWVWTSNVITGKVKGDPRIIFMALEYAKLEDETRDKVTGMIERNRKELHKISYSD